MVRLFKGNKEKQQEEAEAEIEELQREIERKKQLIPAKSIGTESISFEDSVPVKNKEQGEEPQVKVIEREITLSLLNDKLNYLIELLSK